MTGLRIQRLNANSKIVYIDGRPPEDSVRSAVQDSLGREMLSFYYDQFRHFDDPAAPFFQFLSRDADLMMGIGGVVRIRGWYDADGAISSPGFAPYLINVPHSPTARHDLGTTPAGTCIFFQVLGHNRFFGRYQLYIECNFNGYKGRDFHLKKAYAMFRDFTVGFAPSTFSDVAAQTPMVDANGPSNKIAPINVLVRYMPTVARRWVFAISVEDPSSPANVQTDASCASVSRWTPDIDAFAQFQWAPGQHVRISGMWRLLPYRDLVQEKNKSDNGWAVQFSSVSHPHPSLTLYASADYGHGYTSILNDLLIGKYDLVPDPDCKGHMYSPAAYGWHLGLQYNFRPEIYACVATGQVRYLPSHAVPADEYRRGAIATVNVFWNPTPRSMFGLEYDWGQRKNQGGASATAGRIGAVCQFSF